MRIFIVLWPGMHCRMRRARRCIDDSGLRWWACSARTGGSLGSIGTFVGRNERDEIFSLGAFAVGKGTLLSGGGIVREGLRRAEAANWWMLCLLSLVLIATLPLEAEAVSLQALVTPSTTIVKDGRPVTFALHNFIEFKSLAELFPYIDSQARRWNGPGGLDDV